ncbi:HAD family hydrolase [bacterium]|nr:HAD family hydrolase [bacterium]
MAASLHKAVFLDRDGTLIANVPYLHQEKDVVLLEPVIPFLLQHQADGYLLVMVTNQSGVARGMYDEATVRRLNQYVCDLLAKRGVTITACYYCPHHPWEAVLPAYRQDCACRKPAPGMLLQAAKDLKIDLSASIMVGDSQCDLDAGKTAGCRVLDVASLLAPKSASFQQKSSAL